MTNMFEKLCDNLNLLMAEVRISADELARRTGIPASTIKKIRNRYNPNPTLTTLLPLAQYFLVTLGQLVGDEPLPKERVKGLYQENLETVRHIPIITWKEIITWPSTSNQPHPSATTEHEYSHNTYALVVQENDWENLAKDTVLLVDPTLKAEHRDFAIIYKEGQQIPSLKQILYDEEQIYLKPLIEGYKISPLTSEHKILGIVVEYKKHLRLSNSKLL